MICCSCIFVFLRACYPVQISLVSGADTAVHTWVDVELRVVGQHVAVNIKNPNRSWVHNRGPQQKSTFLPGLVFLKVDWVPFGMLYWVIWPEPRCWDSRNNLGWLVSSRIWWSWCIWGILCPSFGAWSTLCLAAVLPRSVAKLYERCYLFARNEWFLMIRRIRGKSVSMVAVGNEEVDLVWCQRFWVARPSGFGKKEQFVFLFVLQSISEETSWKTAES